MAEVNETGTPPPEPTAPNASPALAAPSPREVRQNLRRMRLTLTASDPAAGAALEAARQNLATTLATPDATATAPVGAVLAALALGNFEAVAELIRHLGRRLPPDGRIGHNSTESTAAGALPAAPTMPEDLTPHYLLLLARFLAWTGEIHLLRQEWPHVLRALTARPETSDHPSSANWELALHELTVAAESLGEVVLADLRCRLEPARPAAKSPAPPRGMASPHTGAPAEQVVDYYLHEILGVEPDAPRNRLVLRPSIPESWDRLEVEQLRFGDAEIAFHYRRDGSRHHFTLTQESGAVPVRVIFEPLLPARHLAAARVDGQHATLDPRPLGDRLIVPLQIVLDAERVVELEGGEPEDRKRIRLPVR